MTWAVPASAAVLAAQHGTWTTCATACTTGQSDAIKADGSKLLLFDYTESGQMNIVLQECPANAEADCSAGSLWTDVIGSGSATNGFTDSITDPGGLYRVDIRGCSNSLCTYTVRYRLIHQVSQ